MYIIIKWWGGIPQTMQLATQNCYATRQEAKRVVNELTSQFPGRTFAGIEISGLKEAHTRTDEVT